MASTPSRDGLISIVTWEVTGYMVKRFRHKGLERLFQSGDISGINAQHAKRLRMLLTALNVSTGAAGMNLPGARLRQLRGERKGEWAVSVSGNGGWCSSSRTRTPRGLIWSTITELLEEKKRMEMHDPAHPGEVIKELCLEPLGLTVTAAADALGVTRKALSDLLNGHAGVSPDMAIRLEKVFGSTADSWLQMQLQRNLWEARQRADQIKVNKRFVEPTPA